MAETANNYPGQEGHHHVPDAQAVPGNNLAQEHGLQETDADNPEMIADLHIAACFDRVLGMEKNASPLAARRYVEQFLAEAKQTDDPVEFLLLQQLIMAHHRIANLHFHAATADKVENRERYSKLAQQLLAELRRTALAVREYRLPAQGRQTTVIHRVDRVDQLNHAEGTQDVSYARQDGPEGGVRMMAQDTELVSKTCRTDHDSLVEERQKQHEESQASCGWSS